MATVDNKLLRKLIANVSTITLDKKLHRTFQRLALSKGGMAKVRRNPKAFLKAQGFALPSQIHVKMGIQKNALPPNVGSRVPRATFVLCFTITITVFPYTNLVSTHKFTYCKTYTIF